MNTWLTLKNPADLTLADWYLFDLSMECTEAAVALQNALIRGLACSSIEEARRVIDPVRMRWARFGAMDTEPREVVNAYLNAQFDPLYSPHLVIADPRP